MGLLDRLFLVKKIVSRQGHVHFQRWRLLQTPWLAIYIHKISRSDEDEDPHDHPWDFRSYVLAGGYTEEVYDADSWLRSSTHVRGDSVYHPTTNFHKITLLNGRPAWTLVFTGRRTHPLWGYKTKDGWVNNIAYRSSKWHTPILIDNTDRKRS